MRIAAVGALLVAWTGLVLAPPGAPTVQDPVRVARPPVGADPLPPIPDPPPTAVERADLNDAFLPRTGYEGFYRLVAVASGGRVQREGITGYLAVGRQHLALHVVQAGPPGRPPLVQSGFRSYRVEAGALVTTALVGHDNLTGGELHFDAPGLVERRQLVRTPTSLRVVRDEGAWMEFVRVE